MISTSKHYKLAILKFLISIIFIIGIYLYIYLFIAKEHYIYSFDFGQHYIEFIQVHNLLVQKGFLFTLNNVLETIRHSDYNLLSALLLSPFSFINTSRLIYLYAIITVFYLPAYWLFLKITFLFNSHQKLLHHFLITSLFFLSPTLLTPILRNESSIDGLIPILLIIYVFFQQILNKNLTFKSIVPLVLSLSILPLLHRWYLPFTLSFLFLFPFFSFTFSSNYKKNLLYNIFLFLSTISFFILASQNLWKKFFLINYSQIYHVFQLSSNPILMFIITIYTIGSVIFIMFLISIRSLYQKNIFRLPFLFLLSIFTLCTLLFLSIQNMNVHHYYLIIIPLILTIAIWITTLKLSTIFIPSFIFILIIGNFIYPATHHQNQNSYRHFFFFSSQDNTPWSFPQTKIVEDIISDLYFLKPRSVYTLSQELWFNASSLTNFTCYFNKNYLALCPHIAQVAYFASIDGPAGTFFESDYFILNQRTLNSNTDPAIRNFSLYVFNHPQYYQVQKNYLLPNSEIITLYRLIKSPPQSDFNELVKSIQNYYDQ